MKLLSRHASYFDTSDWPLDCLLIGLHYFNAILNSDWREPMQIATWPPLEIMTAQKLIGESTVKWHISLIKIKPFESVGQLSENNSTSTEFIQSLIMKRDVKSAESSGSQKYTQEAVFEILHKLFHATVSPCLQSMRNFTPPVEAQVERTCVYCRRKITKFDDPLSPEEAGKLPRLCPNHFDNGRIPKKYLREPQDPRDICQVCTVSYRIFSRMCYFTTGLPIHYDSGFEQYKRRILTLSHQPFKKHIASFTMDSMPKNNSIGTSKGGKSIFQAAFKLYS
ncbi:Hypothetical predicted protein [Cloeon dipterum]|uniref:Uncharacterized protein n=1 Tax=Cloeon dipterum TaxID=197152 RepID=A0A8S1DSP2_9INSE|nr:Hypothetical predicted protein [Cloeon dipterum]